MNTTTGSQTKAPSLSATLSRFLTSSTALSARVLSGIAVVAAGVASPLAAHAITPTLPSGGVITGGDAVAKITTPDSATMQIDQYADKAIGNFSGGFNTSAGATVNINQPSANSIFLARDLSGNQTQYFGDLNANGKVWIINPNGMLFGKTSTINVGGLLLSTDNISDTNFQNPIDIGGGKKRYYFDEAAPDQQRAIITLKGAQIETHSKGDVIIQGAGVAMRDDTSESPNVDSGIETHNGNVILASGQIFSVDFDGDNLVGYEVHMPVTAPLTDPNLHDAVDGSYSNIYVGPGSRINQQDSANAHGTVRFIAKVNEDAIRDHVINLGGVYENFGDYVSQDDEDSAPKFDKDPEHARISPFKSENVEICIVSTPAPTPKPTQPPEPTPSPTPEPTPSPTPEPTQPPEPTPSPTPEPTPSPTPEPTQPPEPTPSPTPEPTPSPTPEPTRPPEPTPEPTFPPEPTPEPTQPPAPTPTPTPAPAPVGLFSFFMPEPQPLTRPNISAGDEGPKDGTVDPKLANETYERPYLISMGTSIADGKLTLLSTGGSNGSPTNLGNLAPAAGGNNLNNLSPAAGGNAPTAGNSVNCANAFLDHEWSTAPEQRDCTAQQQNVAPSGTQN